MNINIFIEDMYTEREKKREIESERLQLSLALKEHQNWIMSHNKGQQLILMRKVTTLYISSMNIFIFTEVFQAVSPSLKLF